MKTRHFTTIRSKITLVIVVLCVALSLAISAISYSFYYRTIKKNMIRTAESSLVLLGTSIDNNMQDAYSFVRACQSSNSIISYLQASGNNLDKISASTYLKDNYNTYEGRYYVKKIFIGSYLHDDFIQTSASTNNHAYYSIDDVMSEYYFDAYCEAQSYSYEEGILTSDSGSQYLPIIRPIYSPYNSTELGFIYLEMSTNVVTIPLKTAGTYENNDFFLTLDNHIYQYSNRTLTEYEDEFVEKEDLTYIASYSSTTVHSVETSSGSYIAITVPLASKGCSITQLITISSFYNQLLSIIAIIVAIALATGLVLHAILNHMVNVPVHELQERMHCISNGNFDRDSSIEWSHELGDIGRSINDLAEDVHTLMEQRIQDENQKREYEYKMLQSQINPHFLYNTLNSIKWMATIQNAPGIAEMTTALSRLLKSIAKGTDKLVPLSAEISLLDDYFTIQKYRYGGTISMNYEIECDEVMESLIPRFTLQPIVENAIFHGIEPKGTPGTIQIHIHQTDPATLQIDITDDGVGMDAKTAANLLEHNENAKTDFFKEIGISNVHKRLQFEFGQDFGLFIESKINEFTTVSVRIPFGEERNNGGSNQ